VRLTHSAASDLVLLRSKPKRLPQQSLAPCRILLVEDGVTNRKLISLVLERAGAKLRCAENGQSGLEAAAWEAFDLILMDMQMPVMDGYAATRELRRLGYTMPIIALTAHAMAGDERKCREAGCSGYLTKPIDPQDLLEAVAKSLQPQPSTQPTFAVSDTDDQALVSKLPMDDPEFHDIVDEFVGQLKTHLTSLRAAWTSKDMPRIAEIAHFDRGHSDALIGGHESCRHEPAWALRLRGEQPPTT
jgi:CheY-like chemotaxis protein